MVGAGVSAGAGPAGGAAVYKCSVRLPHPLPLFLSLSRPHFHAQTTANAVRTPYPTPCPSPTPFPTCTSRPTLSRVGYFPQREPTRH